MIDAPDTVCFHSGRLRWSDVENAEGYNIHLGQQYLSTVVGSTSVDYDGGDPESLRVSSWKKEGGEEHSVKSDYAVVLLEPLTCDSSDKDGIGAVPEGKGEQDDGGFANLFVPEGKLIEPDGELVIDERFESLNTNWRSGFPYWDQVINNELQVYTEDALSFSDDGLCIKAEKQKDGSWKSGLISGKVDQSMTYGFYEASIKWNGQGGFLPAFWLLNTKYVDKRPEIDIWECPGFGSAHQSYHHWTPDGHHNKTSNQTDQITDRFVAYGVDWKAESLTFYIDREPVYTAWGDYIAGQNCYPILNLAVGGNWPKNPAANVDSAELFIKWFRVWQ